MEMMHVVRESLTNTLCDGRSLEHSGAGEKLTVVAGGCSAKLSNFLPESSLSCEFSASDLPSCPKTDAALHTVESGG